MAGMPYGLQAMLKDGHKHMQGVDEAVLKNIDAARGLASIARTSLGPNGTLTMDMILTNFTRLQGTVCSSAFKNLTTFLVPL